MKKIIKSLVVIGLLLEGGLSYAELTVSQSMGFDVNWYYQNTFPEYARNGVFLGYYRDYNSDGLPDYLIRLRDPADRNWRIFALDTAPTGGAKTYAADRTAGRDIHAQWGTFVPTTLYTPRAPSLAFVDLVVVGTDRATTSSTSFAHYIFWRLDTTDPMLPTETSWTIYGVNKDTDLYWPDVSCDGDDYPDLLVCTRRPNAGHQFVVRCHNGRDGALLWTRTLDMDAQDPGTGIYAGMGNYFSLPTLRLSVLRHAPDEGSSGDLDGDGKPDLLLAYGFGHGVLAGQFGVRMNITLLNASGGFVSPYTGAWTQVYAADDTYRCPRPVPKWDFDVDGSVDLLLWNDEVMGVPLPPLLTGYSLREQRSLFETETNDFNYGNLPGDLGGFQALPQKRASDGRCTDVNGDGLWDLNVFRDRSGLDQPLRIGLFNANGDRGATQGRKIWLTELATFNAAFSGVNDFNGDDLLDFVIVHNPTAPDAPTAGEISWRVANGCVTALDLALAREFDCSHSHSFSFDPVADFFRAATHLAESVGDVDGDGRPDTLLASACAVDNGRDRDWDQSYGYCLVYDNAPSTGTSEISAELVLRVANENWVPAPLGLCGAVLGADAGTVDNNRDGFANDIVVDASRAVFALSYQYRIGPGWPGPAGDPDPADGAAVSDVAQVTWSEARDASSYDVYFGLDETVIDKATTQSIWYRGNQTGRSYVPPMTLECSRVYYWRIDARNAAGVTKGAVWRFRMYCEADAANWRLYR